MVLFSFAEFTLSYQCRHAEHYGRCDHQQKPNRNIGAVSCLRAGGRAAIYIRRILRVRNGTPGFQQGLTCPPGPGDNGVTAVLIGALHQSLGAVVVDTIEPRAWRNHTPQQPGS